MTDAALDYYARGGDPTPLVLDALRAAGRDVEHLSVDDLAGFDEFHALGRPATLALAELAGIGAGTRVADIGAGLGGPARVLAARFGARVTAVEPSAGFRAACVELTARTGLADQVTVVDGTATATGLPDAAFDVVWMQAVAISVGDKAAMARELRRILVDGGRLALFDMVAGPGGELHYPVPWADGPAESHVIPREELQATLEAAGFEVEVFNGVQDALASIGRQAFEPTLDPALGGLHQLMPRFEERMATLGRNVGEQRLELVQAVLRAV